MFVFVPPHFVLCFSTLLPPHFPILLTYSGKPHNTKEAVAKVHLLRAKKPESTAILLQNIGNVTRTARNYLEQENISNLGTLIVQNQQSLESLGVSSPEIRQILILISEQSECFAKLTGAGKGGCVVTLGAASELKHLQQLLEAQGFSSIITTINHNGVNQYE